MTGSSLRSFVIFRLGERRYALATEDVVELAREGDVQRIPHTSPSLEGIMVRRGEILPVWAAGRTLAGCEPSERKWWLVTRRNYAGAEPTAIPIGGECLMLQAEIEPPAEGSPAHVAGVLRLEDQPVEVLNLERLGAVEATSRIQDGAEGDRTL